MIELNKIYNTDCIALMKEMHKQGIAVDSVITSPPYNNSRTVSKTHSAIDTISLRDSNCRYDVYRDNMSNEEYIAWTCNLFDLFDNILTRNGVVCYNVSYGNENPDVMWLMVAEVTRRTNFSAFDCIIWKKKSAFPNDSSTNKLTRICEYVILFARKNEIQTHFMNSEHEDVLNETASHYIARQNIIEAANNDEKCPFNNATYSSSLVTQLAEIYTPVNGLILDPFMGTGTTALAALMCNRRFIGSELSPNQCEWALNRLSSYGITAPTDVIVTEEHIDVQSHQIENKAVVTTNVTKTVEPVKKVAAQKPKAKVNNYNSMLSGF